MRASDTIVAAATPAGESALAVVRVSGTGAATLAAICHGGAPPPPRFAWHGEYCSTDEVLLDDAVFCFFAGPKSYTGEDLLEISCHGNPFIVSKIIKDLIRRGCRLAEPGEFTKRAFLHGRMDLTEAEAVMDLIRARSDQALAVAQRQLRGALRQRIDVLVSRLLDLCASVDAHVDFPEEDLPMEDRRHWHDVAQALSAEIQALAATRREGDWLREGVKVVLLGAPNAGKSSLLNRLVGFERAIVSADPGTTRDFIEEKIFLDGWCIRLFDTAGVREASGDVEQAGVFHSLYRMREADILVLVVDATLPCPPLPEEVLARLVAGPALVVMNKSDLGTRGFPLPAGIATPSVAVSALRGDGLDALRTALSGLVAHSTADPGREETVVVNARHELSLIEAAQALSRAAGLLKSSPAIDLAALDIRAAIEALGDVVGRVDYEEVLDRLFASFCIGK